MGESQDIVTRNRALQTQWYGEPLGERIPRLLDRLRVPQSDLASALGLSAPMLSQLIHGHRAKISNPAVLTRLLAIEDFAASAAAAAMGQQEVLQQLTTIHDDAAQTSSMLRAAGEGIPGSDPPGPSAAVGGTAGPAVDPVTAIQAVLRSAGSAAELEGAAAMLQDSHPDLAAVLRVYGTGRTSEARAHFAWMMAGQA